MKEFERILTYIIEQDDMDNIEGLWLEMVKEPELFIYRWYMGTLDGGNYIDEVNQDKMYDYIRQYRTITTERDRGKKPRKINDGVTIKAKCEKAGVSYSRVRYYRHSHPELNEDEVIKIYQKKRSNE